MHFMKSHLFYHWLVKVMTYFPHPAELLPRTKLHHHSFIPHSMPPHIYFAPKIDLVTTCSIKKFLLVVY